jgi:hypothetical protein
MALSTKSQVPQPERRRDSSPHETREDRQSGKREKSRSFCWLRTDLCRPEMIRRHGMRAPGCLLAALDAPALNPGLPWKSSRKHTVVKAVQASVTASWRMLASDEEPEAACEETRRGVLDSHRKGLQGQIFHRETSKTRPLFQGGVCCGATEAKHPAAVGARYR